MWDISLKTTVFYLQKYCEIYLSSSKVIIKLPMKYKFYLLIGFKQLKDESSPAN